MTKEIIIKSKLEHINIPEHLPIYHLIWSNVHKWPQKIALECAETKRNFTFKEVQEKSLLLTKYLRDISGLNFGDTVALILPNLPEYPICLFGSLQAGLVVTCCNPAFKPDEIGFQLRNSDAKLIFTTSNYLTNVQEAIRLSSHFIALVILNTESKSSSIKQHPTSESMIDFAETLCHGPCEPVEVNADDAALLLYSSGTTGLPKGVQISHRNIVSNFCQATGPQEFNLFLDTTDDFQDVVPAIFPFCSCYGMVGTLLETLFKGGKTVTFPKFSSELFIKILREYKPTILKCVPLIVHLINNKDSITSEDLASIRNIISGGAPLGAEDVEKINCKIGKNFHLTQGYGLTEASGIITLQWPNLTTCRKLGSVGTLIPNTEAKIVNEFGESLGPNQQGELLVRGPQVTKGYYKNPEATAEIILNGGWLKTGDIGYYDTDEQFFITDRSKELIKVKGFQVAPAELEKVLRTHPCVQEVGVIGVPHSILGEAPKAFVVLKENSTCTTVELQEFVASKVVEYKTLAGGVVFIDELPKSHLGKPLRRLLKNL